MNPRHQAERLHIIRRLSSSLLVDVLLENNVQHFTFGALFFLPWTEGEATRKITGFSHLGGDCLDLVIGGPGRALPQIE